MKAVLMSIQPRFCELIASGKKTVEVRKTKPKLEVPFKVYIYCTKDNSFAEKTLRGFDDSGKAIYYKANKGKVIGEFVCDTFITDKTFGHDPLFNAAACLTDADAASYCVNKETYGWHISNLIIYDKPRELGEFFHACEKPKGTDCSVCVDRRENRCKPITRPPQSWCYCEEVTE